jgi:serine protease inhibitor
VQNKTNQEIQNLISSIESSEIMFLINAIYFKGVWTYEFDATQTKESPFTEEDGSVQQVITMFSGKPSITEFAHSKFLMINIPYGNKQFSMTVLLPNLGNTVQEVTGILSTDSLNFWLSHADTTAIGLSMPKFKMNWKSDLKKNLEDMGMAMNGFPHLFEQPKPLEISRVIHQSSISVDETGTEAAAATGVGITYTAERPPIVINRPFLFLIREKHSGVILFMGQLYSPDAN